MLHQRVGHLRVGRQVQVGEDGEVVPEPGVLVRLGLLDLADQVGPFPHFVGRLDHLGPGPQVVVVGEARPSAGPRLHQHAGPLRRQLSDAVGGDGHPELVGLGLGGDTYQQR
jgi:hypothetical protein